MDDTQTDVGTDSVSEPTQSEINVTQDIAPIDITKLTVEQRLEKIESLLNLTT